MKIKLSRLRVSSLLTILVMTFGLGLVHGASSTGSHEALFPDLRTFRWHAGAKSCDEDKNPAIQSVQVDESTFVLRQNKCTTFEAPFIYVLAGSDAVLVLDTGAIESSEQSPVYQHVRTLVERLENSQNNQDRKLLVLHSHSHSDHTKGDAQFEGKQNVELVGTYQDDIIKWFAFDKWPLGQSTINLGGRKITVLPIPGHQDQSIALYDEQTNWLLTGDTLYPGSIRVKDWDEFKSSIHRLNQFVSQNPVSLLLGSHIEMNATTHKIYSIGSTYQPDETPLALKVAHLEALDAKLQSTAKSRKIKFDSFEIAPLSFFEKMIIKAMTRE